MNIGCGDLALSINCGLGMGRWSGVSLSFVFMVVSMFFDVLLCRVLWRVLKGVFREVYISLLFYLWCVPL